MTLDELFEKEVEPIAQMIEDLLCEKKIDHFMGLVALASVLGVQLHTVSPECFMDQLLRKFVNQNLEKILEKKTRESN